MKAELLPPPNGKLLPKLPQPRGGADQSARGFTRLELAVTTGMVLLLMVLALPAVANKARSQQAGCWNNLRQIGRAYHEWANEHGHLFPYSILQARGGTAAIPNAWGQFGVLTNELKSPQVLVCPSDDKKRPAGNFSTNPEQGFFHANFRNSAVSYFLAHPFWRQPRYILAGDRNIQVDRTSVNCSQFGIGVCEIESKTLNIARWTNNMHVGLGHFLHADGGVDFIDNSNLPAMLFNDGSDNGAMHLAMP